jgi:methylase of polypeptide subunit release factors
MSGGGDPEIRFDDHDYPRAREVLERAGYSSAGLQEALGTTSLLATGSLDLPPRLRRTRGGTPRETLARLFFLGVPVELEMARRALSPMTPEQWARARLIDVRDGQAVPLVKITPHEHLILAADLPSRMRRGSPDDFVLGVGQASTLLAHMVVDRRVRQTLDLGTGCGVLALLASARSEQVCATDKNARAVAFAWFNARLNGVANVECLTGDLFEPVAGRRFGLVVSNPPYVIAPAVRYMFSDSGVRGDEFCRRIVRLATSVLEEDGYGQVMGNWAARPGQTWRESLAGWFDGTGCDVLVWGAETQDASSYGTTWIQQTEPDHLQRFSELYDAWMSYYDREGIETVTYGLITMRRRSRGRPNWVRFVNVPKGTAAPGGAHILRRFEAQDFLESVGDDRQLLDHSFRLSQDLRLEQHYVPRAQGFSAQATRLHLARDPAYYTMDIDSMVTTLVMYHRGERRLREVFEEMAAAMRIGLDELAPGGLAVVRELVEKGFLVPGAVPDGEP